MIGLFLDLDHVIHGNSSAIHYSDGVNSEKHNCTAPLTHFDRDGVCTANTNSMPCNVDIFVKKGHN